MDYLNKLRTQDSARSQEIKPLLTERNRLVKEGQPLEAILSRLFILKEQQRKIHSMIKLVEKVENSLQIKPCFLDYGINFGMKNVESQWRRNLIENDNLVLPALLSSKY